MRKRISLFLLVILASIFALSAAPAPKVGTPIIYVSLDSSNTILNIETIKMAFTSNRIADPVSQNGVKVSNFKAFNTANALAPSGIILTYHVTDNEFYADSNEFYISWQVYSSQKFEILISVDGPMGSGKNSINWKVSDANNIDKFSGTDLANTGTGYQAGSFAVFSSDITYPGVSGSCPLVIKTQPLWGKELTQYTGYVVASVNVVS